MEYGPALTARYLAGRLDKYVKQAARDTIMLNVREDREGNPRYARVPDGDACEFCKALGSRGFVYHSERSAGGDDPDHYHPHCNCQVAVSFDPAIESYYKNGTHVTRGYGAEDAQLARPGRDGAFELRPYDIDALFDEYMEAGRSFNPAKSRVFKRFEAGSFMDDPIKYLSDAQTVDELESRAAEVLAGYKDAYSDKQLAKYLPSARSAAKRRMGELKAVEKASRIQARIDNAEVIGEGLYDMAVAEVAAEADAMGAELAEIAASTPNVWKSREAYRSTYARYIEGKATKAAITIEDFTKVEGKELQTAKWFSDMGVSVHLRNPNAYKDLPKGNTSDVFMRGMLFDFKRVESSNPKQITQQVARKLNRQGPGFVVDLSTSDIGLDEAITRCATLLERDEIKRIVVIKNGKAIELKK